MRQDGRPPNRRALSSTSEAPLVRHGAKDLGVVFLEPKTSRLRLRPVRPDDALATAALMNDEIASYLTTWPPELSPAQAASRIEAAEERLSAQEAIEFAITRRADGKLLGWLSFVLEDQCSSAATVGFWLGEEYQGQGLMTEAATAAMPVAASFLRATTLDAHIYPWNSASIGLVRKLGFWPQGGVALYSPVRGRCEDAFLFRRQFAHQKISPQLSIQLER